MAGTTAAGRAKQTALQPDQSLRSHLAERCLWLTVGVGINAFSIALIAASGLGVGAISCVAYVLSNIAPLSFGGFTFVINMLFIAAQILLLRRDFQPVQLLQIVVNVVFSLLIDVSGALLGALPIDTLPARIAAFALGCLLLALGVSIEVAPNVIFVPGEGIVHAIHAVTRKPFGTCKAAFDTALVVFATALSLLALGRVVGVGIGTVISAVAVGRIVNHLNMHLPLLQHISHLSRRESVAKTH